MLWRRGKQVETPTPRYYNVAVIREGVERVEGNHATLSMSPRIDTLPKVGDEMEWFNGEPFDVHDVGSYRIIEVRAATAPDERPTVVLERLAS